MCSIKVTQRVRTLWLILRTGLHITTCREETGWYKPSLLERCFGSCSQREPPCELWKHTKMMISTAHFFRVPSFLTTRTHHPWTILSTMTDQRLLFLLARTFNVSLWQSEQRQLKTAPSAIFSAQQLSSHQLCGGSWLQMTRSPPNQASNIYCGCYTSPALTRSKAIRAQWLVVWRELSTPKLYVSTSGHWSTRSLIGTGCGECFIVCASVQLTQCKKNSPQLFSAKSYSRIGRGVGVSTTVCYQLTEQTAEFPSKARL